MRKHKSVVAILLAVMMIFTFMPTMAFAADSYDGSSKAEGKFSYQVPNKDGTYDTVYEDYQWDADFAGVTINGTHFPATREMLNGKIVEEEGAWTVTGWDGVMKAKLDTSDSATEIQEKYANFPIVTYFDADFAAPAVKGNAFVNEYTQKTFEKLYVENDTTGEWSWDYGDKDAANLIFSVPTYVDNYSKLSKKAIKDAVAMDPEAFNWVATLKDVDYKSGLETNQPLSIETELNISASETAVLIKGAVPTKSVTVLGYTITPEEADYYIDSTDNVWSTRSWNKDEDDEEGVVTGLYDGAEHTVVADPVPGWTVSYSVYNPSTAKYDAVDAVKITDVQVDKNGYLKPMRVKATYKQANRTDRSITFDVNLAKADVTFGFDTNQSITDPEYSYKTISGTKYYYEGHGSGRKLVKTENYSEIDEDTLDIKNITYAVSGSSYNTMNYVTIEGYDPLSTGWTDTKSGNVWQSYYKAAAAASKAAVAANKADLAGYMSEGYEVKETASKADANVIALQLKEKDLTLAETKALTKKYEKLFANFNIIDSMADNATLKINYGPANTQEDDITFSGVTTKVYKAKKSTKKLAKAKSFKVAAVADSGNKITFSATKTNAKIKINKNTGKITVKKGLKKGTYKITVKAKTAAGNGYKAAKASKTYTIKVK